jgi:hypothetical protein
MEREEGEGERCYRKGRDDEVKRKGKGIELKKEMERGKGNTAGKGARCGKRGVMYGAWIKNIITPLPEVQCKDQDCSLSSG